MVRSRTRRSGRPLLARRSLATRVVRRAPAHPPRQIRPPLRYRTRRPRHPLVRGSPRSRDHSALESPRRLHRLRGISEPGYCRLSRTRLTSLIPSFALPRVGLGVHAARLELAACRSLGLVDMSAQGTATTEPFLAGPLAGVDELDTAGSAFHCVGVFENRTPAHALSFPAFAARGDPNC